MAPCRSKSCAQDSDSDSDSERSDLLGAELTTKPVAKRCRFLSAPRGTHRASPATPVGAPSHPQEDLESFTDILAAKCERKREQVMREMRALQWQAEQRLSQAEKHSPVPTTRTVPIKYGDQTDAKLQPAQGKQRSASRDALVTILLLFVLSLVVDPLDPIKLARWRVKAPMDSVSPEENYTDTMLMPVLDPVNSTTNMISPPNASLSTDTSQPPSVADQDDFPVSISLLGGTSSYSRYAPLSIPADPRDVIPTHPEELTEEAALSLAIDTFSAAEVISQEARSREYKHMPSETGDAELIEAYHQARVDFLAYYPSPSPPEAIAMRACSQTDIQPMLMHMADECSTHFESQ